MAGTIEGGKQAARTNKAKYGESFYARIGQIGGRKGTTGGFAAEIPCKCEVITEAHLLRQCAGKKGGLISTRVGIRNKKDVHGETAYAQA